MKITGLCSNRRKGKGEGGSVNYRVGCETQMFAVSSVVIKKKKKKNGVEVIPYGLKNCPGLSYVFTKRCNDSLLSVQIYGALDRWTSSVDK